MDDRPEAPAAFERGPQWSPNLPANSVDDVIAAVDIEGIPRDQFGAVHP